MISENAQAEEYSKYLIKLNSVPEEQFDFGDFGWAFQVFRSEDLLFRMVIKSVGGDHQENARDHVRELGRNRAHMLIDKNDYEVGECYCYKWIASAPDTLKPVSCEGFVKWGDESENTFDSE